MDGNGLDYAVTITTGVPSNGTVKNIPLLSTGAPPGALNGMIFAMNAAGNLQVNTDMSASVLQSGNGALFTIPLATQSDTSLATQTGPGLPGYTLQVPAANPNVGAFASSGTSDTQTSGPANFVVDGLAFVANDPTTPDCSPPEVQVPAVLTQAPPAVIFRNCM